MDELLVDNLASSNGRPEFLDSFSDLLNIHPHIVEHCDDYIKLVDSTAPDHYHFHIYIWITN
jgi:hypothetical protein